jgi:hypothetical protein
MSRNLSDVVGHLWYDRHQGFISSFLLYPAYHLDGISVEPEINPLMAGFGAPMTAAFGGTWNKVVVNGPIGPGRCTWRICGRSLPRSARSW